MCVQYLHCISVDTIHRLNDSGLQACCCTLDLRQVCRLVSGPAEQGTLNSQDKAVQRQDLQVDSVAVATCGLRPDNSTSGFSSTACVVEQPSSSHVSGRTSVGPEVGLLLLHLGDARTTPLVVLSISEVRPTLVVVLGWSPNNPNQH